MSYVLRIGPRTLLLDARTFVIGSGPHSHCRIVAAGVAEQHAALVETPDGVRVTPLDGRTFISDVEITKPTLVTHAMTIKVAQVCIQLIDTHAAARERLVTQQVRAHDVIEILANAIDAIDDAIEAGRLSEAGQRIYIAAEQIGNDTASRRFLDPIVHRATQVASIQRDARWIPWVLELCGGHQHVPSSSIVDGLVELSRATGWRADKIAVDYAKSVASSEPSAQLRVRRLLALG